MLSRVTDGSQYTVWRSTNFGLLNTKARNFRYLWRVASQWNYIADT